LAAPVLQPEPRFAMALKPDAREPVEPVVEWPAPTPARVPAPGVAPRLAELLSLNECHPFAVPAVAAPRDPVPGDVRFPIAPDE